MLIPVNLAMAISFALTGIWWGVFTIPMLKNVKQRHYIQKDKGVWRDSFKQLAKTFKEIAKNKSMLLFLIAYSIPHLSTNKKIVNFYIDIRKKFLLDSCVLCSFSNVHNIPSRRDTRH